MNQLNPVILCVDDEEANLKLLEKLLVPRGYVVVSAASGKDALLVIRNQTIDLVLLDIIMPGMDGFEVCRQIKEDQKLRSIPVIMVTALNAKQDRIRGIEAGAEEFLSKPFDQTEILARIKILLNMKALDDERKRAEAELQKSHDELECKVQERTAELAQANEMLQADITERKRAEEELTLSETRYRRLFESAKNGILILDAETGKIVDVNPFLVELLGYTREKFIGKAIWEIGFFKVIASSQDKFLELHQKEFVRYENLPLETVDGRLINIEFVSNIYLVNHRKVIQYNIQDITGRTKAESQLKATLEDIRILNEKLEEKVITRTKALEDSQLALLNLVEDLNASTKNVDLTNQKLTATNKELEAFSYSVSHDLRAPLRGMDGFSQALLEDYSDKLDATGKNYLERIRAGTQRMGLLIDDMLKLSRINRSEFKRESVDLSKMVQAIGLMLRQNNPARDVEVSIQKDIIIEGDRHLLEIALTNLMDNAWKFTGKTKNARIEFGTEIKDGKPVMFIRDNGIGFDMTYVDKLFGAFQRLHTTEEFPGTGIGLATVQRVIHRHGGKVWAEGEVGKGAVFYFTLP